VEGQAFTLTTAECAGDQTKVHVNYAGLPAEISVGGRILIDDGLIELRVERFSATDIHCTVLNGGKISSRKGVNVPGVKLNLPYMSDQDRADLRFIAANPFSYVAASFVRSAEDIRDIREELLKHGCKDMKIIAKIENAEGINHIEEIMEAADGIMVARGDLGVEVPLEEVPVLQKHLIRSANRCGIPVITATQMLESMIEKPRPSRAEISDVANAVYDGSSAIMLSGETAAGKYPVEACNYMAHIAERTEQDIHYRKRFLTREYAENSTITHAVAHAAVMTAHDLNCTAILTMTESGKTALHVSKFRPEPSIVACTPREETYHRLALYWGVIPLRIPQCDNADALSAVSVATAMKARLLHEGDRIVITAGIPLGQSGATNTLKVSVIGE